MAMRFAPAGRPNFDLIFEEGVTSQVATWSRTYGKENTAKFIFLLLEDLNNYFNVSRPMTTAQLTDLAIEFTDALWGYRMEEILAFGEAVKKQTYAKVFERFDPAIVWEHLGFYNAAREQHFFHTNNQFKQYDPRIEDEETAKLGGQVTNMAGAINKMRTNLKRLS